MHTASYLYKICIINGNNNTSERETVDNTNDGNGPKQVSRRHLQLLHLCESPNTADGNHTYQVMFQTAQKMNARKHLTIVHGGYGL